MKRKILALILAIATLMTCIFSTAISVSAEQAAGSSESTAKVKFVGFQRTVVAENTYGIRFLGVVDDLSPEVVGFDLALVQNDGTKYEFYDETTEVYKSITAYVDGEQKTITAEELGGKYIFVSTIKNIPSNENFKGYLCSAYSKDANGVKTSDAVNKIIYQNAERYGFEKLERVYPTYIETVDYTGYDSNNGNDLDNMWDGVTHAHNGYTGFYGDRNLGKIPYSKAEFDTPTVIGRISIYSAAYGQKNNKGITVEASVDGVTWNVLWKENGELSSNTSWNELNPTTVTVNDPTPYNYIRVVGGDIPGVYLHEVEVYAKHFIVGEFEELTTTHTSDIMDEQNNTGTTPFQQNGGNPERLWDNDSGTWNHSTVWKRNWDGDNADKMAYSVAKLGKEAAIHKVVVKGGYYTSDNNGCSIQAYNGTEWVTLHQIKAISDKDGPTAWTAEDTELMSGNAKTVTYYYTGEMEFTDIRVYGEKFSFVEIDVYTSKVSYSDAFKTTMENGFDNCNHQYKLVVNTPAKALQAGSGINVCTVCGDSEDTVIPATNSLKVLAIGNSFSEDAMAYLWDICKDGGVETVVLGNLRIGSCDLDKHWTNIQNNNANYTYDKNTDGTIVTESGRTLASALAEEDWDIITIQQVSGKSGKADTFGNMDNIASYLKESKPNAQIMWQMSWAYAQDSTHGSFPDYDSDQMTMYNAIVNATQSTVATKSYISGIIPSGTAVQNMRTSYIGDNMDRDGHHMSYSLGRYTVALTWYACLTGGSVENVDWIPTDYASIAEHFDAIRESVNNAVKTPYGVTNSNYSVYGADIDSERFSSLSLDPANYKKLDFTYTVGAYWNSNSYNSVLVAGENNSKNFIALPLMTKSQLPVGSVIMIDDGYQYRPDGWLDVSGTTKPTSRPNNVKTSAVVVTEEWWGDFAIRGINLSETMLQQIMQAHDAVHIRIYIPKDYEIPVTNYERVTVTYEDFGDGKGGQDLSAVYGTEATKGTLDGIKLMWDGKTDTTYTNYAPNNAESWTSATFEEATVIGKIVLSTIWNPTANIGTAIQAYDGNEWVTLYTISAKDGSFAEGKNEWKLEKLELTVDDSREFTKIRVYDTAGGGFCFAEVEVYTVVA